MVYPVTLQSTYRIADYPPDACSLQPGELYVEHSVSGGLPPRLWVGTRPDLGFSGNTALIVSSVPLPDPAVITVDPIDNPSTDQVHIVGAVEPGCEVEICVLAGLNLDYLTNAVAWSPFDASADGAFDLTWWVPAGDNYRVRVRMRDNPQAWADSNLFAVQDSATQFAAREMTRLTAQSALTPAETEVTEEKAEGEEVEPWADKRPPAAHGSDGRFIATPETKE